MPCVTSSCPWFITSVTSCLSPEGPGKICHGVNNSIVQPKIGVVKVSLYAVYDDSKALSNLPVSPRAGSNIS